VFRDQSVFLGQWASTRWPRVGRPAAACQQNATLQAVVSLAGSRVISDRGEVVSHPGASRPESSSHPAGAGFLPGKCGIVNFTLFGAKFSRSHPAAVAPIFPISCRSGVLPHGGMANDTTVCRPCGACAHEHTRAHERFNLPPLLRQVRHAHSLPLTSTLPHFHTWASAVTCFPTAWWYLLTCFGGVRKWLRTYSCAQRTTNTRQPM
jgi:hypothetical protein